MILANENPNSGTPKAWIFECCLDNRCGGQTKNEKTKRVVQLQVEMSVSLENKETKVWIESKI